MRQKFINPLQLPNSSLQLYGACWLPLCQVIWHSLSFAWRIILKLYINTPTAVKIKICVTPTKENPAIKTSKSHWLQQKFNGFGRGGYADTYMCNAYTLNALHLFFVILYEQERVQRYLFNVFILYLWL